MFRRDDNDKRNVVAFRRKPYPDFACAPCMERHGGVLRFSSSTWHMGKCPVCDETQPLTEPRDFGWPNFPGFKTHEEVVREYVNRHIDDY